MKRGFTLIEVNLSMLVVSAGILVLVILFSLGYRENRQSMEDVRSVAVAQANLSFLTAALSTTNMTWSDWERIPEMNPPETAGKKGGWAKYAGTDVNERNPVPLKDPTSEAKKVFSDTIGPTGFSGEFVDGDLACGLVVVRSGSRCSIAIRSGLRPGTLIYQPLYYTEVQFQGLKAPTTGGGNP